MYNDPSNQAVNIFTRLADFALKTIGTVTKHVTAAFYAVYRDHRNADNLKGGEVSLKRLLKSSRECRMFTLTSTKAMEKFREYAKKYHIPFAVQKHMEDGKTYFNISIRGEDAARVKYVLGDKLNFMKLEEQGEINKQNKKENPSKNNSKEQDSKDINKTKTSETIEKLKDYKDKIDKGDIPADKTVDIDIVKDMDIDLPSKD